MGLPKGHTQKHCSDAGVEVPAPGWLPGLTVAAARDTQTTAPPLGGPLEAPPWAPVSLGHQEPVRLSLNTLA